MNLANVIHVAMNSWHVTLRVGVALQDYLWLAVLSTGEQD